MYVCLFFKEALFKKKQMTAEHEHLLETMPIICPYHLPVSAKNLQPLCDLSRDENPLDHWKRCAVIVGPRRCCAYASHHRSGGSISTKWWTEKLKSWFHLQTKLLPFAQANFDGSARFFCLFHGYCVPVMDKDHKACCPIDGTLLYDEASPRVKFWVDNADIEKKV
jgi:hypothetical protein